VKNHLLVVVPMIIAFVGAADVGTASAAPDVVMTCEAGRFIISYNPIVKSTLADPCNMGGPSYWDDRNSPPNLPFDPQAQCQGTGVGFPYAPQVVSCGTQGACMRFGAGAGGTVWNRSEIAIGDQVPFYEWHRVEFKFKFPNTIPNTYQTNDPFIAQLWHQAPHGGRQTQKADIVGGVRLHTDANGVRHWVLQVVGAKETSSGQIAPSYSNIASQVIQPEQWVKLDISFLINPQGVSYVGYKLNSDVGWSWWWGQMGYDFDDVLGETTNPHVDVKIGVYTPPLSTDLRVYLDDIVFDRYDDGVVNWY
jgi:hypothetical protein